LIALNHRVTATSLLILVLFSPLIIARPVEAVRRVGPTWDRTYAPAGHIGALPGAISIQQTRDRGFIMSTEDTGVWVIKTNAAGISEWQRQYTPLGYAYSDGRVTQTMDGGYIVVGTAVKFIGDDFVGDGWLLKLDHQGNIEWSKTYGGAKYDSFLSGRQISDGGYIVSGNTESFGSCNGFCNGWVLRLDPSGGVILQETFEGQVVRAVDQTNDGGFIVAGTEGVLRTISESGRSGAWLLKLDPNGGVEWEKTYDFSREGTVHLVQNANSAHQTSDGGYIVVGEMIIIDPSGGFRSSEGLIFRVDRDGNILWQRSYIGGGFTTPSSAQQTSDNGFIVAGMFQRGFFGTDGLRGAWLIRLDADGTLLWQKMYGTGGSGLAQAQETRDGGVIAIGSLEPDVCCHPSLLWAMKLDSDGNANGCPVGVSSNATLVDASATVTAPTVTSINTYAKAISNDVTTTTPAWPTQNQCEVRAKAP